MSRPSIWTAVLAVTLAACGDARYEAELASPLYAAPVPVAPREIVSLAAAETAAEVDASARFLSLGGEGDDERATFGRIADVAATPRGDTVYVVDAMQRRVAAFAADGRFLFAAGGRGEGPGEYEEPVSATYLPWNGGVAVWDVALQRLTFLAPDGSTRDTRRPLPQGDLARLGRRLRAWRGGLLLEVHDDALVTPPSEQRGHLVRLDTAGHVRDTVLTFRIPPVFGSAQEHQGRIESASWTWAPRWTPRPTWDVRPDGEIVFAPGGRPDVYLFSPDGEPLRMLRRPWTPAAVTWRQRVDNLAAARDRGMYGPAPAWVLEMMNRERYARVRPAIVGVLAAPDGRALTRRFDTAEEWDGRGRTWDVAGAGDPSAVRFPAGFTPLLLAGGRVFGVRQDSLDVDHLEGYAR